MPTRQPPPAPNAKDILMSQGCTMVLEVQVAGVGSIVGAEIALLVKKRVKDADAAATITKRTGGLGITITEPGSSSTPGKFEVRFDPNDTLNIDATSYEYDCKMRINGDVLQVIERSHFDVSEVVTRSV